MPGFLAVIANLLGGTVAKAVIAATAALTMVVGGGAATGLIPIPGADTDPAAVAQPALDQANEAVETALSQVPAPPVDDATPAVDVATETPAGSASTNASTNAVTPSNLPAGVPDVSTFIPEAAVPPCVSDLVPTGGSVPDPTQLVAELPTCILSVVTANLPLDLIQDVIGGLGLPVDISGCLTSVMDSLPTFVGGDLSGLSGILSDCLPTGMIPGGSGAGGFPGSQFIPGGSGSGGFSSFIPGGSGFGSGGGSSFSGFSGFSGFGR